MTFIEATRKNHIYPMLGIWFDGTFGKKIERKAEAEKHMKYDYSNGELIGYFDKSKYNLRKVLVPFVVLISNQYKENDGIYIIKMPSKINNEIYCTFVKNKKFINGSDRIYFEEDIQEIIKLTGIDKVYDITYENIV